MGAGSLFDRLGFETATRIALALYDRVMESERLERYFVGVDMERLIEHQALFLATLMGGPASYSDEQLKLVHAPLGIDDKAFGEMLEILRHVLADAEEMSAKDIDTLVTGFGARRSCVVTGGKQSGNRVA